MGKYMKKSKITGDVAVMEVSQPTTLGVRTRARTLALQRTQSPPPPPACGDDSCYLQLRSRRLEKSPPPPQQSKSQGKVKANESGRRKQISDSKSCEGREGCFRSNAEVEGSFGGDNCLEFEEVRERCTRESTPCSLMRDSDNIETPGSTTRQSSITATNRRVRNDRQRSIPASHELEEFFACAELQQHKLFMEKYNFDFVNEVPLPGRYEWVQFTP